MLIAMGGDHAGYDLKNELRTYLLEKGYETDDLGAFSAESVDYPDFAHPVARMVESGKADLGILICGSANGVAMTANKHENIRAAIAWKKEIAELARQHNDANILCLPARYITVDEAKEMVDAFIETPFEGGRHQRRVEKIAC
jgi:ribose 5-phosphate isomerase B